MQEAEIAVELFIRNNRKGRTVHLEDGQSQIMVGSDHIFSFRCGSDQLTNSTAISRIDKFYHLFSCLSLRYYQMY